MFYNFNTFNVYMSNAVTAHGMIFGIDADSTTELSNHVEFSILHNEGSNAMRTYLYQYAPNKLFTENGFTELEFLYSVKDVTKDMTIPLKEFPFEELYIKWGSFGNCFKQLQELETNNTLTAPQFAQVSRFIIDESLVFNLAVDIIGTNHNVLERDTNEGNSSLYYQAFKNVFMKYKDALLLYDNPEEHTTIPQNIYDSLLTADSTVYDRPCDVSQDVIGIDQTIQINNQVTPILVLDGSFTKLQPTYFSYYNENVNVKFKHETIPQLIILGGSAYADYDGVGGNLDYECSQLKINALNSVGKSHYTENILRYYIGDEYTLMKHGWQNTIFGNFNVGNNLVNGNDITPSPQCEQEVGSDNEFINGTVIQFSPFKISTKAANKPTNINPIDLDNGEGEGEIISAPMSGEIISLTPQAIVNTQDEFIYTVHHFTTIVDPEYATLIKYMTNTHGSIDNNETYNGYKIKEIGSYELESNNEYENFICIYKNENGDLPQTQVAIRDIKIKGDGYDLTLIPSYTDNLTLFEASDNTAYWSQETDSSSRIPQGSFTITIAQVNINQVDYVEPVNTQDAVFKTTHQLDMAYQEFNKTGYVLDFDDDLPLGSCTPTNTTNDTPIILIMYDGVSGNAKLTFRIGVDRDGNIRQDISDLSYIRFYTEPEGDYFSLSPSDANFDEFYAGSEDVQWVWDLTTDVITERQYILHIVWVNPNYIN